MNKENRNLVLTVAIVAIIFIGGYASIVAYTGYTSPFSVVTSQSMQHDNNRSEIGIIDTGDIVLIRDPSKETIVTYVEGYKTGYSTFGDYGSVIIYNRGNDQNPVIHRAILWLDYNDGVWSAPSLKDFDDWYFIDDNDPSHTKTDWTNITGTLFICGTSISMSSLSPQSGYLTKGDNNSRFDQPSIIDHLVTPDEIRSIPVMEIPWLGTLKILINNGGYHSIRQTQQNLFSDEPLVGVGCDSHDLAFPDFERIAGAFGISYVRAEHNTDLAEAISRTLKLKGPVLCEVFVSIDQPFEPRSATKKNPDGSLSSPPLEDMAPFLPEEEMDANMIVKRVKS